MQKLVVYVHGKGGSAAESEHYQALFEDYAVVGLDYKNSTPWETGPEIHAAIAEFKEQYPEIILIANSVGAFFCLHAQLNELVNQAFFISPLVDMEKMISQLMQYARVSEAELEQKKLIPTSFGEDLSWEYLSYVRAHKPDWRIPTHILYGGQDNLISADTLAAFTAKHHATLTVMQNGEHWFHTQEQLRFLDAWIKDCCQVQRSSSEA